MSVMSGFCPSVRTVARSVPALLGAALVAGVCAVAAAPASAAPPPSRSTTTAAAASAPLAKTPPMGFNDWNAFGCNVDEQLIEQTADLFVSSGLKAAGYQYVNIDDCWMLKERSASGHLVPDPQKFPDGIKGTADYVHSKGLKLGIYNSAGDKTCAGYPGSLGHEQTDADDYAAWGVDYLKYDNCGDHGKYPDTVAGYKARYNAMGNALKATGRPIVFSLCEWGVNKPWNWAGDVGQLWRTTGDINDSWGSLKSIIAQNAPLSAAAHPGAWNDPDMLEVGNGGMTDTEYKTHFGLWAEMAAPLLIGTDLRKATPETMAIYENKDVVAVDQDRLGVQGQVIAKHAGTMVFTKPLANGDRAVALYNSTDKAASISTTAAQAGLPKARDYALRDLWSKARTESAGTIAATVPAHGTTMYRVSVAPTGASLPPATSLTAASASGYGSADAVVEAGATTHLTTTVADYGRTALTDVRVTGDLPDGWTLAASTPWHTNKLGTDRSFATKWALSAPADAKQGSYPLHVTVTYRAAGRTVTQTLAGTVLVAVAPPAGANPVSDLTWQSATNDWGPVEKDMSNGETAAGDGQPITIRGHQYAKGLGTNAPSDIVYYLGGACSTFTSDVGIDDEKADSPADATFEVYAGTKKVADSGALTGTSPVKTLTADVTGADWLRLHVDPDGSSDSDHGDWAGPVLTCSAQG